VVEKSDLLALGKKSADLCDAAPSTARERYGMREA